MSHRLFDFRLYSKVDIIPTAMSGSADAGKSRLPKAKADTNGGANGIDVTRTVRSMLYRDGKFELNKSEKMKDATEGKRNATIQTNTVAINPQTNAGSNHVRR
jgi:hypothetical protein